MQLQYFRQLEKFNIDNEQDRKHLFESLQFFMALPDLFIPESYQANDEMGKLFRKAKTQYLREKMAMREAELQAFGKPTDFPASVLPVIEKFHAVPDYDRSYEQIFDIRNYAGSKRNGFEVGNVTSGLAFERAQQGVPIQVYEMSGTKATCYFDLYGGALSWSRILFDDEDWWSVEDNAKAFVAAAYSSRAQAFYTLLEAVGDNKGCCDWVAAPAGCNSCDSVAWRDALSMNLAARTVLAANQNKGYGLNQNPGMIVLSPLRLRGRIRRAMGLNLQQFVGSPSVTDWNFTHITSLMLGNPNRFYVILPKRRLKGGYRMDLSLFSDFDILTYADVQAGWMRYGGCIGDTDQIECVEVDLESGSC